MTKWQKTPYGQESPGWISLFKLAFKKKYTETLIVQTFFYHFLSRFENENIFFYIPSYPLHE